MVSMVFHTFAVYSISAQRCSVICKTLFAWTIHKTALTYRCLLISLLTFVLKDWETETLDFQKSVPGKLKEHMYHIKVQQTDNWEVILIRQAATTIHCQNQST